MKAFDEWARGKSLLIRIACLGIASAAEDCLEFLDMLKVGKRIEGYQHLPPTGEWLKLYRKHRWIYKVVVDSFREISPSIAKLVDCYELVWTAFRSMGGLTNEELQETIENTLPEVIIDWRRTYSDIEKLLKEDISKTGIGEYAQLTEEEKRKIRKIITRPEMIFFYRVWVPCYLLYGIYPICILRKARQGDEDAIEKLLRLDKSIISDTRVKEIFHQAAVAQKRGKMVLMTAAMAKAPKIKVRIQTVKYTLGGLISLFSIALGQKIGAADIRRLFDALAMDAGKGIIDEDLEASPETFEKAIQRARSFWMSLLLADKK